MRCLSLLENVTESISALYPLSTGESCIVLPCFTSQILILLSLDPNVTYLSSYENATDGSQSLSGECPNEHCTCLHFLSSNHFVHRARHDCQLSSKNMIGVTWFVYLHKHPQPTLLSQNLIYQHFPLEDPDALKLLLCKKTVHSKWHIPQVTIHLTGQSTS